MIAYAGVNCNSARLVGFACFWRGNPYPCAGRCIKVSIFLMSYLAVNEDICALATVPGVSALAVVRCAGPACLEKMGKCLSRPERLLGSEGYKAVFSTVTAQDGAVIDECVIVVFRAPKSPTGQDGADIMCHGGHVTARRIIAALERVGIRLALPGEFLFRAVSNGKADVVAAEAVDELIRAKTEEAQEEAAKKLKGGLRDEYNLLHSHLIAAAAACAVQLDYGEEEAGETAGMLLTELRQALELCRALLASYSRGRLMQEGALVVFAGKTNAGKSSLFNRLVREERSIVSEVHGTTRDYVEAEIDLAGIPVRLADTAGLRDTNDEIEAEGVRRTELLARSADLIVYVVDAELGCSAEDEAYLEQFPGCVKVWNKTDKPDAKPVPQGWIGTVARTGSGEHALASNIHEALLARYNAGSSISCAVSSARQHAVLERIETHIGAVLTPLETQARSAFDMYYVDLQEALAVFAELVGETSPEMILDSVFSKFCVGK